MSSNWLDRLSSSSTSKPRFSAQPPPLPINSQQPSNPFTRITHSLSDLFCVGHPHTSFPTARKFPRKQPYPMHYIVSNSSDSHVDTASGHGAARIATRNNVSVSPMISNCALNESMVQHDRGENFNAAQEEEDPSLDGFSRTEVTVIDTSFAGWKFETSLFRKDATWKARDKKANKATVALRKKIKNKEKKRKSLVMPMENFEHKKLKVLYQGSSMLKTGSSSCNQV